MRKIYFLLIGMVALSLSAGTGHAESLNFIFLYPGGQGSQEQAQPILDAFSTALKKASGGKFDASIHYFNDAHSGEEFIRKEKPCGGILAEDLFATQGGDWQAEKLLVTLQLPSGDGANQYFLLGSAGDPLPATGPITVYTSRPIAPEFLTGQLFPDLKDRLKLETTGNVVGLLRKIGKGEIKGRVLLDQFEAATITQSKAPWAQALQIQTSSQKVPAAPWVVFPSHCPTQTAQELKTALLKLSGDGSNRPTLEMLRLKGFR